MKGLVALKLKRRRRMSKKESNGVVGLNSKEIVQEARKILKFFVGSDPEKRRRVFGKKIPARRPLNT